MQLGSSCDKYRVVLVQACKVVAEGCGCCYDIFSSCLEQNIKK